MDTMLESGGGGEGRGEQGREDGNSALERNKNKYAKRNRKKEEEESGIKEGGGRERKRI